MKLKAVLTVAFYLAVLGVFVKRLVGRRVLISVENVV